MTTPQRPPKDDLFRAMSGGMTTDDGKTLTIRLAPHDSWAEIDSVTEGHFMERFRRNAYRKTLAESKPKIMFQHGKDPQIGEKVIASTDEVGEDEVSPFARGQILDGVPELVVDGLRKGVYGSSHRFSVVREDWDPKPKGGPHNPGKLPERTITEARLYELGPVTWPAYAQASVSLRSLTDEFRLKDITSNPEHLRNLVNYIDPDAPSVDAAAQPHLEPERRETVAPPTPPTPERNTTLDQYVTREEKASRVTELKQALTRQAIEYPGVLPAEAQTTWDADTAELEALERDIAAWDSRQARLAAYAADPGKVERTYEPIASFGRKSEADIYDLSIPEREGSPEKRAQLFRDNAMRSVEQSTFPHPASRPTAFRDHLASLLDYKDSPEKELAHRILLTGSPLYRRAFNKLVLGIPLSPEESRAAALAVTGTTTTGGYMIPYVLDPTIIPIGAAVAANPFRAACRVEQIVGGNNWRAVTATAVTAIYETEAAAATEAGPTIGQPTLTAQRASTFVSVSTETLQDRPDLPSELAVLIQEGKDVLEEAQYAGGTGGTVYPFGMFYTGAFANLDSITDNVTAIADLYAIEAALPLRYRRNAAWFMSRATLHKWQAFETVYGQLFGGQYYAATPNADQSPIGNTGLRLLNYPIWEVPSAPHAAADFTTNSVIHTVFGDPKQYVIVDRVGMNIEVIPHLFDNAGKPKGQRGIFAMWRNTARPLIDGGDGMVSFSVQ